jgi:hypothetical protein
VVGAIIEVNYDSPELDRPASNLKLERSIGHACVYGNPIVIPGAIDIRPPERLPSALISSMPLSVRGDTQSEQNK